MTVPPAFRPIRCMPRRAASPRAWLRGALVAGAVLASTATAQAATAAGKPIMTREELRACMKLDESVRQRTDALQAEDRDAQGERQAAQREGEELAAAVTTLDRTNAEAVEAHNARARAHDSRVQAWNAANHERQDRAATIDKDRQRWQGQCASRRFREDDEIAIKRGR